MTPERSGRSCPLLKERPFDMRSASNTCRRALRWLALAVAAAFSSLAGADDKAAVLPGARPLAETGDLSVKMVDGIHRVLDRKLAESVAGRARFWKRDLSSPEAYERSIAGNRERFKAAPDQMPVYGTVASRFNDDGVTALYQALASGPISAAWRTLPLRSSRLTASRRRRKPLRKSLTILANFLPACGRFFAEAM